MEGERDVWIVRLLSDSIETLQVRWGLPGYLWFSLRSSLKVELVDMVP